jgi:hypothetical protein
MFTLFWLADALKATLEPPALAIQNSDGDELLFSTAHYPLEPGTSGDDIRSALRKLPELRQENDHFWNWLGRGKSDGEKSASDIRGSVQTLSTTLDDGSIVLGTVELREKELTLEVNSQRRAERGRALLQQVIGGLCVNRWWRHRRSSMSCNQSHPRYGGHPPWDYRLRKNAK